MKSILTVSGVVFAHICVFLLLVNGCRSSNSETQNWNSNTGVYSGGARSAATPAQATSVETQPPPAQAVPAKAESSEQPTKAEPAKAETSDKQEVASKNEANSESGEKIHIVKKGEVLSMIAVRNGLTAKELASANGIELNSILREGQKLKIPAAKPKKADDKKVSGEGKIYVVKKGDILGKIAQEHKTTVAKIKEANNLKNDVIRVGQKLVIPSKDAKKSDLAPATEKSEAPAQATSSEAQPAPAEKSSTATSAQSAPAEKKSEATASDENFGMPAGGFGSFNDVPVSDAKEPEQAAPAQAVPAK